MPVRQSKIGLIFLLLSSLTMFLILPILGWGSLSSFFNHPARAGACIVSLVATIAVLFSGANLCSDQSKNLQTVLIIAPVTAFSLVMAWLPAYADRRQIAVFDGDTIRYTGLVLLIFGCILRIGPMFVLGSRFRPPWLAQEDHRLVTTGFYRYIRNPSYLGAFVAMMGWFLVFRCVFGFLLSLILIPVAIHFIRKEEAMLQEEFQDQYSAYKKRTWRLIPFIN